MSKGNKKHNRTSDKKDDGKFHSKHIKHDPNAESARAVFGLGNQKAEKRNMDS